MSQSPEEEVSLRLSKSEALVLFEFTSRFSEKQKLSIEDRAEERVLCDICCLLEKQLVEPLKPEYAALLTKAREVVRDEKPA